MKYIRIVIMALLVGFGGSCLAAEAGPAPADRAFVLTASVASAQSVHAHFKITPGYYLYKNHLHFSLENGAAINPKLPVGIKKHVEGLGVFEVYTDVIDIDLPLPAKTATNTHLLVTYQGCSDAGYCYPPTTESLPLDLTKNFGKPIDGTIVETQFFDDEESTLEPANQQDKITSLLSSSNLWTILLSFFGFGLLLAFTPCVLPMIPILSSIIVGQQGKIQTRRAFLLSLTYVLAMSTSYALAGVLVGYLGSSIQAALQQPWILAVSSAVFVALALSLFGLYEIRLPRAWQNKLTNLSNQQAGGSFAGVAIMGFLATLIVSPCVTPALVGALGYIGKSGNALLGGIALFTLGFGMGVPLIIIGTAGGKLLPKAGTWMKTISNLFGVVMLAMAIWLLQRILPGQITMALWASLLIVLAVFLGLFRNPVETVRQQISKGTGALFMVYGSILMVGVGMGNGNPLQPLEGLQIAQNANRTVVPDNYFKPINNIDEVQAQIDQTKKIVLLDFYADWCTTCKFMEKNVFDNPKVQALLKEFTVLKANVTHNNPNDKELQQFYSVVAPPTLVFLNPDGSELTDFRVVGEMQTNEFIAHLEKMLQHG